MNKLRTTSWFLLLVILLATLVSFTMAQETPAAGAGQVFQKDSFELQPGKPLAHSLEEVQIEQSTSSRQSLALPAITVDMSPAAAAEDAPPEPTTPIDSLVVQYPDDLPRSLSPNKSSPVELAADAGAGQQVDFSGRFVGLPQPAPSPTAADATCKQLLVNTKLDVTGGSIAPWVILDPKVYFSTTEYVSPQYSLLFADNDSGDTSPNQDAFGQAFTMPSSLTEVTIRYATASANSNTADEAFGNLWSVDKDGNLDQFLLGWEVGQSPGAWQTQTVKITDKTDLQLLQGKNLAVLLFNSTTGSDPAEVVFFDDITLNACQLDSRIIVKKETNPAGAAQKFTFDPSWSASNFQLSHGQSKDSGLLAPGNYSVKELAQSGWDLGSATCSDGSNPNNISLQAGETVTCTFRNVQQTKSTCGDVLVNSALNIVEFGDGTGTAEPWSIFDPIVYYTHDPAVAYDGYSLLFKDGDSGDPSPQIDSLAQAFQMPGNLTEISIEYRRATQNTNSTDDVYGNLWLLDDNWVLDTGNPDNLVMSWEVGQQDLTWVKETGTWNDAALMNKMSGKKMAIILFSRTDGGGTKENVYFDEVYISACSKGAPAGNRIFMASIMKAAKVSGPVCNPPSESPADQWYADRGLVQTSATCNSTLSNVDRADYYTFKPTTTGNHTLRLTNLPGGTEWSAMIFIDTASPDYAPGGASDGKCRITQPGSVNKQVVCNLNKNTGYFVKVSAGSTPVSGSYTMRITVP